MTTLQAQLIATDAFHFAEPGKPCEYWTTGEHIVKDGQCRCGKMFMLTQIIDMKEIRQA